MNAVRCAQETDLAWALIDTAKLQLEAVERDRIFVILGAGDTFLAIRLLLKLIAAKQILLRPHLVQLCSKWLDAYALHEEAENLRRLIEGLLIGSSVQASTAIGDLSTTPRPRRLLTVRRRRLIAQQPAASRALR